MVNRAAAIVFVALQVSTDLHSAASSRHGRLIILPASTYVTLMSLRAIEPHCGLATSRLTSLPISARYGPSMLSQLAVMSECANRKASSMSGIAPVRA